ncbi:MAG: putative DNA binding domain-containing protein, partial [Armatimonadetes bacterium]|nr:putative DNA binding domain-containing protein [Armatimonadota bacterium]
MALTKHEIQILITELQTNRMELAEVEAKCADKQLPKRLEETLSALSNRNGGGVILLGVDESGGFAVTGVIDARKLQADLVSLAADAMEPPIRPEFCVARIEGRTVLAAEIPESPVTCKPCYCKSAGLSKGPYIRVGASNRRMTDYEIHGYLSSREQPTDDSDPVLRAVRGFVASLAVARPGLGLASMTRNQQLAVLGIAVENEGRAVPTLAGLLVFGRYPQQFFPSLVMTFLRYVGTDDATPGPLGERFLDNRKFEGSIPAILNDAQAHIVASMRMGSLITGLIRDDIPEYPIVALREALVNAVAHRDYSSLARGSQIQVRMFSDRLELQSPGGLFGTVTEDNIEHEQSTRNQVLMRLLEDLHLVENRGTGIRAMLEAMRRGNLEPPVFRDRRASFWVAFKNHTMMDAEAVGWLGQFSHLDINDHQRVALVYLRTHHRMANRDYQRLSSVDGPTATKDLRVLVNLDLATQHGTRG